VDLGRAAREWQTHGFVILPGFVPAAELGPALAELSLLAVSDRVVDLAQTLLADSDLRISSAEAWAKYTGAADYDQPLHRDYLNHTLMAPADDPRFRQLEMFSTVTRSARPARRARSSPGGRQPSTAAPP
jgi:hypothetical protein